MTDDGSLTAREAEEQRARRAAEESERKRLERRLTFRAWLWVQHREYTEFAPLARLILGGGPDNIWVNKHLKPSYVCGEVEMFYASGRQGITAVHVDLAQRAPKAYEDAALRVSVMIRDRAAEEKVSNRELLLAVRSSATAVLSAPSTDFPEHAAGLPYRDHKTRRNDFDVFDVDDSEMLPGDDVEDTDQDSPAAKYERHVRAAGVEDPEVPPGGFPEALPGESLRVRSRPPTTAGEWGAPVPVVTCSFRARSGGLCNRTAITNTTRCDIHGGTLIDPEEARATIRASRHRLLLAAEVAVDVVVDLMQNSVNDVVRLKAAELVLDRAGVRADDQADGPGSSAAASPAEELRSRLNRLVVQGEVVESQSDGQSPGSAASPEANVVEAGESVSRHSSLESDSASPSS